MTDFLRDPDYIDHLNKEAEAGLLRAIEAVRSGAYGKAIKVALNAKDQFGVAPYYMENRHEFDRVLNDALSLVDPSVVSKKLVNILDQSSGPELMRLLGAQAIQAILNWKD